MDNKIDKGSNDIINIIVVVDTDRIINDFRGKTVSRDYTKPTSIDPKYTYMVVTSGSAIGGTGTGDLNVKANVGDVIRWTGVSESGNFDSSVLVYNVARFGGDDVYVNPTFKLFTRRSMIPRQGGPFPVSFVDQVNWFLQADINKRGKEIYNLQFGLYYRPDGDAQDLLGYFSWNPILTVS